ncbi:hypothetical protein SAMN05216331_10938 [Porphyromonadaceae bacterium KH3R12]|uniref:DUF6157 family protein n=1 Tax=Proteiniphilum TaxID=294702 RepID=UPI000898600E|nr:MULTISPECIES: DUF6157 family protein [Proteiniphilum]MDY9918992.1 DUF6157 family protein [Proteiniphilum sp.]SDZ89362.1 hypothetical protein SAMN05216331_10938 [Porphyromonadaceae bacterium KH3R12]
MKTHTTNYFNTLIEVAEDTKVNCGTIPPAKDKKTVAQMQYELLDGNPYNYSSDDVLFLVYAERNNIPQDEYPRAREQFFSKGQPCMRTSPLTKNYGFGIHSNSEGKIAFYGMETEEYKQLLADSSVKKIKAMKRG